MGIVKKQYTREDFIMGEYAYLLYIAIILFSTKILVPIVHKKGHQLVFFIF